VEAQAPSQRPLFLADTDRGPLPNRLMAEQPDASAESPTELLFIYDRLGLSTGMVKAGGTQNRLPVKLIDLDLPTGHRFLRRNRNPLPYAYK
jgi:hypothetical protein